MGIEHPQALDRPLRREVDVAAVVRCGGDEEQRLLLDPLLELCVDAVVDLAHPGRKPLTADARPERTECERPGVGVGGMRVPDCSFPQPDVKLKRGFPQVECRCEREFREVLHNRSTGLDHRLWKSCGKPLIGRERGRQCIAQHLAGGQAVRLRGRFGWRVAGAGRVSHEQHRRRHVRRQDARVVARVGGQVAGRHVRARRGGGQQRCAGRRRSVRRRCATPRLNVASPKRSRSSSTSLVDRRRVQRPHVERARPPGRGSSWSIRGSTSTRPTVPTAPGCARAASSTASTNRAAAHQRVAAARPSRWCRRGWPRPRTPPASAGAAPARRRSRAPGRGRPGSALLDVHLQESSAIRSSWPRLAQQRLAR